MMPAQVPLQSLLELGDDNDGGGASDDDEGEEDADIAAAVSNSHLSAGVSEEPLAVLLAHTCNNMLCEVKMTDMPRCVRTINN